jgi:hypothetical protein
LLELIAHLEEEMYKAAEELEFEKAARLRDRIQALRNEAEGQAEKADEAEARRRGGPSPAGADEVGRDEVGRGDANEETLAHRGEARHGDADPDKEEYTSPKKTGRHGRKMR